VEGVQAEDDHTAAFEHLRFRHAPIKLGAKASVKARPDRPWDLDGSQGDNPKAWKTTGYWENTGEFTCTCRKGARPRILANPAAATAALNNFSQPL